MRVRVKLFAVARELAGQEAIVVELPTGATVGRLREAMAQKVPALEKLAPHVLFAIGSEYADDAHPLTGELEVACIPPVSGG